MDIVSCEKMDVGCAGSDVSLNSPFEIYVKGGAHIG